jgi:excisionase family DNA binding protein
VRYSSANGATGKELLAPLKKAPPRRMRLGSLPQRDRTVSLEAAIRCAVAIELGPLRTELSRLADQVEALRKAVACPVGDAIQGLLSVEEIAAKCHVTPKTVRAWIQQGQLVSCKAGGRRYVVTQQDFNRFLARGIQGKPASVEDQVSRMMDKIGRAKNG